MINRWLCQSCICLSGSGAAPENIAVNLGGTTNFVFIILRAGYPAYSPGCRKGGEFSAPLLVGKIEKRAARALLEQLDAAR